ncbi:DEHA2B08734p [Debaryomyces hansenii CBS767]|uniref:DEHA2B08734p n=1 Tax=Debaryomyces hansenii (strain ATCC 36239 / CBS 767 / BCRC 21394 / JCM 1990 / NBRC 0083 / IGC 2968) TaxID=284592 RepID=Q6BWT4_DEBHA|nr:DEHA2B08734p [Debaryomyces hansenii CBS767]CAG85339.2 DEHA2B08734p [Debaryomyces hansenii CBS767]|eukprot:XP_457335.2 DEHA2B08734p [Debaryomyces hansenii CBS767]
MSEKTGKDNFKYRERASKVLSKMYDKTSDIAGNNSGKNKGIAAGTAASLISLGIDRINQGQSVDETDGLPYTEDELNQLKELESEMDDSKSSHFVDRFMEKLLKHAIPTDGPEKEMLERRVADPERLKKPNLSIRILTSNFKRLSSKMSSFFVLQYGLIHIITWRKPTKTLSFLVFYTSICLWPHLILAYPMIFLIFGVMLPAYIHRHPMRTPELIKVKKRGQSILDFFNSSSDTSVIEDLIGKDYHNDSGSESDSLQPVISKSSDTSSMFSKKPVSASKLKDGDVNERIQKKDKTRHVKSQMTLFINMRDLQNLTTDVLNGINGAEKFWYETAGFKDERLSTFIFYGVIAATSIVLVFGRFIPWRLIFIQSGWAGLIVCHPNSKKYIMSIKKSKKAKKVKDVKESKEKEGRFERHDIIIDDSAEIRIVEVFELQNKNMSNNQWSFHRYTSNMFDIKNHARAAGKRPLGVDDLSKVLPPPDWKFDMGYANKWEIDIDPQKFFKERNINNPYLQVHEDEKEGWIYDKLDGVDNSDSSYEFRRRRLSRECYRYSRPPVIPKNT